MKHLKVKHLSDEPQVESWSGKKIKKDQNKALRTLVSIKRQPQVEEWEKEFDKMAKSCCDKENKIHWNSLVCQSTFKSFIKSLLKDQTEEWTKLTNTLLDKQKEEIIREFKKPTDFLGNEIKENGL